MSDTEEEDNLVKFIKITLVGEPATGKTSICRRFVGANVSVSGGTQGAEVTAAQLAGVTSPLRLCDVAGAALNTEMLPNYLFDTDILIFVYDLTNLQSFERLKLWMEKVKQILDSEKKKPLMALFGNKSDLEHQRAVRLSCVQKFASEYFLENYKGSARTGETISILFSNLLSNLLGIKLKSDVPPYKRILDTQLSETASMSPSEDTASTLIVNRKVLRKVQRKSSAVCSLQ
ncbi:ras-related protein Rab-28-like [Danaus plexippus]|uniref:ras-related protein Rab-28-like n=1 Tax=Danaus plexippus TaxID=13037 RepID=UPI002AAF7272|nr:ras-related protein Rab-28-like [Danaus plexippus]